MKRLVIALCLLAPPAYAADAPKIGSRHILVENIKTPDEGEVLARWKLKLPLSVDPLFCEGSDKECWIVMFNVSNFKYGPQTAMRISARDGGVQIRTCGTEDYRTVGSVVYKKPLVLGAEAGAQVRFSASSTTHERQQVIAMLETAQIRNYCKGTQL
jgi:hypothetical protein